MFDSHLHRWHIRLDIDWYIEEERMVLFLEHKYLRDNAKNNN